MNAFEEAFHMAESLRDQGHFCEALSLYRRLLMDRVRSAAAGRHLFNGADIVLMERVGDLAVVADHASAAAAIFEYSRHILEEAGNHYAADWASVKASSAYLVAGNWHGATIALLYIWRKNHEFKGLPTPTDLARWARSAYPRTDERDRAALVARILLEIGRQHAASGQYQAATVALEYSLKQCASSEYPLFRDTRLPLIMELASAKLERGDLNGCRQLLVPESSHEEPLNQILASEILGKAALLSGNFGLALRMLEEVWRLSKRFGGGHAGRTAALNLAYALVLLNHTKRAADIGEKLLEEAEKAGDNAGANRARTLLQLVQARGCSLAESVAIAPSVTELWGQYKTAPSGGEGRVPALETPILDTGSSRSFLDLFELRSLTFFWLLSRGRLGSARSYVDELNRVFASTDSMLILSRMLLLQGLLDYYERDFDNAECHLRRARESARELGLVHDEWQALRALTWIQGPKHSGSKQSDIEGADTLLQRMQQSLAGPERAIFLLNKWTEEEERLARNIESVVQQQRRSRQSRGGFRFVAQVKTMSKTIELLERIDDYRDGIISHSVASAVNETKRDRQNWVKTALQFWCRTALIRLLVLPDRAAIITIAKGAAHLGIIPITRSEIRDRVACIHTAARDPARIPEFLREMRDLSERLQWGEALNTLSSSVTRLMLLPDDSLHGLPFSAMPAGQGLTIDRWSIAIGFAINGRKQRRRAPPIGFSAVFPLGLEKEGIPPLEFAEAEADVFHSWCARRGLKVEQCGPGQNKTCIGNGISTSQFAHLTCHGQFRPDRPDESGLLIVNGDKCEVFSIRDIAGADLGCLRLVAFTSCWGADSYVLPGRFVISLPEVCWRSGAQQVLACLWPVDDRVGTLLLRSFYENLNGRTPEDALRLAQEATRSSKLPACPIPDTSDPYFWAGFQVYSDVHSEKL